MFYQVKSKIVVVVCVFTALLKIVNAAPVLSPIISVLVPPFDIKLSSSPAIVPIESLSAIGSGTVIVRVSVSANAASSFSS